VSSPSHCPYCGAPVPAGARYCGQCGVPLTRDPAPSPSPRRRFPARVAAWLAVVILVALFGVGTVGGYRYKAGHWPLPASLSVLAKPPQEGSVAPVTETEPNTAVAEYLRSVVAVTAQGAAGNRAGSGFIVDEEGRVVTAAHVVEGARCVTVMDSNGRLHPGTVVAVWADQDLALVAVPGLKGWPAPLAFGDSGTLRLYEDVYVLGFPRGVGNSVALPAQVSRLHDQRMIDGRYFGNLIQITGARVLEGTSGGPLIHRGTGQVVGMVAAGTEGDLAYAIPSEELIGHLAQWANRTPAALCEPVPAAHTTTVLLAAIAPLSGADSIDGADLVDGVILAVRDMEENLRAAGYEVLVQPYDDRSLPEVGREMALQAAANPRVIGVVGSLDSQVTYAVAESLRLSGLPLVVPTAGAEELTAQGWPHVNRIVASARRLPEAAARYAKQSLKLKNIYILWDGTPEEQQNVALFRWAAQVLDLPVVGETVLTAGQPDGQMVDAIRQSGADGIYLAARGSIAPAAVQRLRSHGFAGPILGGAGLYVPAFQYLTGSEYREIFFPRLTAEPSDPFRRHFESVLGKPTRGYAAYGYDAASVLLAALVRYGEEHPAQVPVRSELMKLVRETTGYSGRTAWISFDSDTGENETAWVYMYEWQQGTPVLRERLQ